MSLTIAPNGLLVRTYYAERRRWRAKVRSLQFCDLLGRTSINRGVTMANIFDLVSEYAKLVEMLSGACFVDIEALHNRPRVASRPLVRSDFCRVINKADSAISEVLIEKHLFFAADGHIQTPDWLTTKLGLAVNAPDWTMPLELAWSLPENIPMPGPMAELFPNLLEDAEIFAGTMNLPLRLRTVLHRIDQETLVEVSWTMWEVLVAIYGCFGQTPAYWNTDQPRITQLEDELNFLRGVFERDEEHDSDG